MTELEKATLAKEELKLAQTITKELTRHLDDDKKQKLLDLFTETIELVEQIISQHGEE